jgi:hypothetical protein
MPGARRLDVFAHEQRRRAVPGQQLLGQKRAILLPARTSSWSRTIS